MADDAAGAGDAYGAIVAKRRLARRLTELRLRAGLKLSEASDGLDWSRGRLDRYERNEWRLPDASHVRDLARIYEASDKEKAELEDLGRLARQRVWWRAYEEVFGKGNEFAGFENDAARISVYMPLVLPGLLQTPAVCAGLAGGRAVVAAVAGAGAGRHGCAASRSSTAPTAPRRGWSR